MRNWADGFAKLHSLKFDGNKVYFSGKMIESSTYMDSLQNQELVPQFTLSAFEGPEDEWNVREMFQILWHAINQYFGAMDHNMVYKI